MWSSEARQLRGLAWAVALVGALALGGCTGLRPVYGDAGLTAQQVELRYATPTSRLEQVISRELALRLGKSDGDVPVVKVVTNESSRALTSDTVTRPFDQREMTVTAAITVGSGQWQGAVRGVAIADGRIYNGSDQAAASRRPQTRRRCARRSCWRILSGCRYSRPWPGDGAQGA